MALKRFALTLLITVMFMAVRRAALTCEMNIGVDKTMPEISTILFVAGDHLLPRCGGMQLAL